MVAGTARSGTTWLAELIASQLPCRIMFEPFNPRKVREFHQFHYFQYMRPTDRDNELRSFCQSVFSGDIRNGWIDREISLLRPQYRLIKEVRANLFLKWIDTEFPEVPLLFIVRHPCAVVASRMKLGWATDTDIQPFLAQRKLVQDHLTDHRNLISQVRTPEEKHALIWCISNLVPLRQFRAGELTIVFYENLCLQPEVEIRRIFQTLGHEYRDSVYDAMLAPSRTTVDRSAVVSGAHRPGGWRQALPSRQIGRILAVVEAFGLDHLYGDSALPLAQAKATG